ncbi:hypothetical protein like AT5G17680 [Hibiscus trionum]|uniref:TIR domain-containing protein n=1 Tax=Hibiscus trionum TaxID=183268 RepID=A0A9W7LYG0_HIBTR|nr:hypothetical protein like AT5G17680 [Hibiscus trionum]
MASSFSSSSSHQMKHQVFLSFRGEDTRLNFTSHLHQALRDKGMKVFFDEEKLERGEELSPALSQAIAASNLSLIVLSVDYASSKSCLAELSDIMDRRRSQGHIVLPIFYHVDPSGVRNLGGSFGTSFDEHESNRPVDEVKRWKAAFVEVGKLKGWHIDGGKFDRPETVYIKEIVEHVTKKLMNNMCRSVSEELVGIEDQKKTIMGLLQQEHIRVIGVWGMGGIGKTTLVDAVYNEISSKFQSGWFLQNVSEKIEKQGMESLRNELLSKLLNQEVRIDTPSIGSSFIQQRLNNKRVLVVLDDGDKSNQISCMGVKHFGPGSKIILTSRNRQVLKNGEADGIHEMEMLNKNDSLQLFSSFAFKLLNPPVDFLELSYKFVEYAQGNPLALKVLGCNLHKKCIKEWESEVDTLNEYVEPEISQILKRSYDGLPEQEKNIFLDIAIFFRGEPKENVEKIICSCYKGVPYRISNLVDKCLLDITPFPFSLRDMLEIRNRAPRCISMHDMLQEMGKEIVLQESKLPSMRSRLWSPKDVHQVLKHNTGNESTEGMKLDMFQIDELPIRPTVFENMLNLRYINFYFSSFSGKNRDPKLHADQVDGVSLPDELRLLCWEHYPFKFLSSFNPKNLVVLKLPHGDMEQLWNDDYHKDLVNLRKGQRWTSLSSIFSVSSIGVHAIGEGIEAEFDEIYVDQCGAHAIYLDVESYTDSDSMSNNETGHSFSSREDANTEEDEIESGESFHSGEMRNDESNNNVDSQEDANIEKIHDNCSTKKRPAENKRSFVYDGEEGDRGHKRLK